MKLKKKFLEKVIKEKVVETRNYKYQAFEYTYNFIIIKRIDINHTYTTKQLDEHNWQIVARTTEDGSIITK